MLAAILFAFPGPTEGWRLAEYWLSVSVLSALALAVLVRRSRGAARDSAVDVGSGAPALAFAAACVVGGLAWVFGVYVAYLAVPLLAFCLARWRAESRERSRR